MRLSGLIGVLLVAVFSSIPAHAQTVSASVPGTADIWLAGQPNGTQILCCGPSSDTAPAASPVLVSLTVAPGNTITVSATGTTGGEGCAIPATGPDGCGVVAASGVLGLSGYNGPAALIGVFIGSGVPSGVGPATLPNNQTFSTLSPLLNQVFFVGDGLTGSGSGTSQTFVVPAGATRLFLGTADGPGANFDNTGAYAVTVTQTVTQSPSIAPIPTLNKWMVILLMLIVSAVFLTVRRS